ncbi:short-chain dehydrogenase [Chitinophaga caeni]|uniref:Short-chain dehydrogenase n=1 Tax=Chitinophaga caeni TaxID=2029983 RepID=A0A291QZ38_9BACT|nr:SDR family oxidoreductase [Chitinophaga caeni]ATL49289.1 short-chain dehydrogenase [Chitinophaga caeni]
MKNALITGANKSIGFETARQLLAKGYFVFLGSRDLANGESALRQLKSEGYNNVEVVQLDVCDQASVDKAAASLKSKIDHLDVLINNAGISGGLPQNATETAIDRFKSVFETNLFGVIRITQALVDLLKAAPRPRIVNVSSSMASLTLNSDPSWQYYHHKGAAYLSSKTALNMFTLNLAYELRDTNFKVNAVDPGFIATDFNNHRGTGSVEEAGKRIVKYATLAEDGPTGRFFSEEYNPETWEIPW